MRTNNNLGQWIKFFLTGIILTAENSIITLDKITNLRSTIEKERIIYLGKRTKTAVDFLSDLFRKPVVNIKDIQEMTKLQPKAANSMAKAFIDKKILVETTGFQRE